VPLDRHAALDRFRRGRTRTRALFALLDDAAYGERPIARRHPVGFYEGHLPAFAVNTLITHALGRPGLDAHLETIFACGSADAEATAEARGDRTWPSREVVRDYARAADLAIEDIVLHAESERDDRAPLAWTEAIWAVIEHEEMHHETMAYVWHQLPDALKRKPEHYVTAPPRLTESGRRVREPVCIPEGSAMLGTADADFAWDHERPARSVAVSSFDIDLYKVTNAEYMVFMEATGAAPPHFWAPAGASESGARRGLADGKWSLRAMFERVPLPLDWPVYVTWTEADAYARWRQRRLPSEAEFHRAAHGTPDGRERRYPWGDAMRGRAPANADFTRWDPSPVGAHPDSRSAFGVDEMVGNGWEWTSTVSGPFAGRARLPCCPEHSADLFGDNHYVLKGAAPITSRGLLRPGFRHARGASDPLVYAAFRTVSPSR
jgi:formylglycine-generating enzyme required for sulfatase activity